MGCIVNGPGEMGDVDYGFVGSGNGKVSLYKGLQVVKRSIPFENAVEELEQMIRENGDWADV
jgi:(E)-4-hydroxy-3-methylbut-2-enyl-diphosphate synthase